DQEEAMAMGDQVAVFDAGRIVQVGAPQQVYSNPRTRFVADFLGEANLLVGQCAGDGITISGFGLVPGAWIAGAVPMTGGCTLAVRPEHVTLSTAGTTNGEIVDTTFVGGDLHVRVRVGETVLSARVPSDSTLTAGAPVAVSFRAAKAVED
ncbi:MAG: TOBE domain-containing protein, partial [Actinomycetales bacterium]